MRVHILSIGFTPGVFADSLQAVVKTGADRAIAVHSKRKIPKSDAGKVQTTLAEIKNWIETEEKFIDDEPFETAVRECIRILRSTGKDDELFIHIGGGERHIALALFYATLFVKRKMNLIVTTRLGDFKTEILPPIPTPFKLSKSKREVLKSAGHEKSLTGIVKALGGDKNDYPRVYRHLENLAGLSLVSYDPEKKEYSQTFLGKLVLEGVK